jgi:chromosome segregation ATPase
MHFLLNPRSVAAALLMAALGFAPAQAQTPGAGKTSSLGSGTSSGKLLTRDELRACMTQRETLATRTSDLERQRTALDAEREAFLREREAIKADGVAVDQKRAALDAYALKIKAFQARLDDWRARVAAYNAAPGTGMAAERQRNDLRAEQAEIQKAEQALEPERVALTASAEEAVRNFNARATAADAEASKWNQRNNALNEAGQTLSEERQLWVSGCGNRRYREDDETAIRNGK